MGNSNSLKDRLKNGEMVFGTWNTISSASLVNAIGYSGIDFVVIDCEHGPMNMETAEDIIRAADVSGAASVIRVPSNDSHLILRALDIGPSGIQIPHVSTKAEAKIVVEHSKYWPEGSRGFSPFTRAGRYGLDAKAHAQKVNQDTLVIINVEGAEGLKNLGEIAKVDGVDVIFIGPYDLSQSFGRPGEVDCQEVVDAIRESVDIVRGKGLACGSFARDLDYLDILIDCGVQYLTYKVDADLILQTYKNLKDTFDKRIGKLHEA